MIENFNILYPNIDYNLNINLSKEILEKEFFYFLDNYKDTYSLACKHNNIIKYFQQNNFYIVEKELWKNDDIKIKLIENRAKYLNKEPKLLTTLDILRGFKITGTHYSYSMFNPFIIKKFLKDNNVNICYDPCGGWGHRMLGATEIEKYIYNDFSYHTYIGACDIKAYFDLFNVDLYNNDARTFMPNDNFDAMFTCPPYYNLEHYECGDFKDINEYNEFIDSLFEKFYSKESCKIFGLVIREDLLNKQNYTERYCLDIKLAKYFHCNDTKKKNLEYLYIFKK